MAAATAATAAAVTGAVAVGGWGFSSVVAARVNVGIQPRASERPQQPAIAFFCCFSDQAHPNRTRDVRYARALSVDQFRLGGWKLALLRYLVGWRCVALARVEKRSAGCQNFAFDASAMHCAVSERATKATDGWFLRST